MPVFDASSMIYAWDNYPIEQFPGLWKWMADQIDQGEVTIPGVAFSEVDKKSPECGKWLKDTGVKKLEITDAIAADTMRIKGLLGISGDNYKTGVGENDLLIIATARAFSAVLVSEEKRQPAVPTVAANRKIPSVCSMPEVNVRCINFIEYLKRSKAVF